MRLPVSLSYDWHQRALAVLARWHDKDVRLPEPYLLCVLKDLLAVLVQSSIPLNAHKHKIGSQSRSRNQKETRLQ